MSGSVEKGGSGARVISWVLCFGIGVLAVIPFFADARSRTRVPQMVEFTEALKALRAHFREGDAIRVEPSWWTLPWSGLVGVDSSSESWPFRTLLTSELIDPVEALGHAGLLVLSGFARQPDLPEAIAQAGLSKDVVYSSETISVARWTLDRVTRLRTLTKDLKFLSVKRSPPGGALKTCHFSGGKHRCGSESWLDVGLEERVVAAREVEWLFVHPGGSGASLSVEWKDLPRATEKGRTWLFLRVGPSLDAVRHPEGREVNVEVSIDGAVVDMFSVPPRRFDLERRAILMPEGSGEANVSVKITCEDAAWRETMLEADVLDHLPATLEKWATSVVGR